jgi:hypothetical protein
MHNSLTSLGSGAASIILYSAKQLAKKIIIMFAHHGFHPIRKVTPHDFVLCMNEIKFHDLSLFMIRNSPIEPL